MRGHNWAQFFLFFIKSVKQLCVALFSFFYVTVCETTSNSKSPPVSSQTDSKIKSQTPCKLFKVSESKEKPSNTKSTASKPKCCNHIVFLTLSSVHTQETYWTAKTNTLSLSRRQSQTSSSVSPRCDMSHGAYAHNKENQQTREEKSENTLFAWCNKWAGLFFFFLETLEQRQPP